MRNLLLPAAAASVFIFSGVLTAQETANKTDKETEAAVAAERKDKDMVFWPPWAGADAKGWTNAPSGKATVAVQDKEVRTASKKTLEFHAAGKEYMACGWNWHGWHPADSGTDISRYKNLSFWAKVSGDKKPGQLSVELVSNDNKPHKALDLVPRCPELMDGKWHEVVVPIDDLDEKKDLNRVKVWEIRFATWSQDDVDFSLFVDMIGFDGKAEAAAKPAASQTAPPAPGRNVKKDIVFDGDKVGGGAKGWTNPPDKATVAAQDKEVRTPGKKTMEFHAAGKLYMACGWNWFAWNPADAGTDISGYKNLSFWARVTGDKKPSQLSVDLVANDNKPHGALDLVPLYPDLLDGKWHEVVVPIADLDGKKELNRAKVWEIRFATWSQDDVNFSLFVDEIGFDGAAEPAGKPAAGQSSVPSSQPEEPVRVAEAAPQPAAAPEDPPAAARGSVPISQQIMVDQFGFRPQSEKVVIFASPQEGQNAGTKYTPPAKAAVRREPGGATVLTVDLEPWGGGKTDKTSGDKVWYADISALQAPGTYYVYDAQNRVRSYSFRIAADVYAPVLRAAVRAYFYQRCGGDVPQANGGTWHHPACHLAAGQDRAAVLYVDGRTLGQPRDVHGGWHDAGDYNKYVPFTADVVVPLLMAYELNPSAFGDDWNIPESGNGIPDILDEVRWECDWLVRMQMPDGSVCNRVTERTSKPGVTPDQDNKHERYYTQPTSWATATCAAGLACYARVIAPFPGQAGYAHKLQAAAERAWAWLERHPDMTPADGKDHGRPSEAADASCDGGREGDTSRRVMAAVELWMLDPQPKYEAFFKKHRKDMIAPCFVEYALLSRADTALAGEVRAALDKFLNDMVIGPYRSHADAYLSSLPGYWWGCNQTKSEYGYRAMFAVRLGLNRAAASEYRAAAEDYVHYLHGRNPLCQVYLTNMGPKGANAGAGKSIMQPFHTWFAEKSPWSGPNSLGPAPGLLAGGPNPYEAPPWLVPPGKQPPSKSFRDWNGVWNQEHQATENSWAFTEPAIYYQARYVLLLSQFVPGAKATARAR
ncbi:MAG: glycoside hydrolase family 9 protein [Thermoguttaceae bacterium]|jgi:hypothetical protein